LIEIAPARWNWLVESANGGLVFFGGLFFAVVIFALVRFIAAPPVLFLWDLVFQSDHFGRYLHTLGRARDVAVIVAGFALLLLAAASYGLGGLFYKPRRYRSTQVGQILRQYLDRVQAPREETPSAKTGEQPVAISVGESS
jgi:hypothetical protein